MSDATKAGANLSRLGRGAVLLGALALTVAGCGTRVSVGSRAPVAQATTNVGDTAASDTATVAPGGAAVAAPSAAVAATSTPGSPALIAVGPRPAERPGSPTVKAPGAAAVAPGLATGGPAAVGASPGMGSTPPGDRPAPVGQDTSPIVIASLGTMSGPGGSVIRRVAEGVQLWVVAVNAAGGIGGHPVKHSIVDDGQDPARYKAELQRLVERENVIALVGNPDVANGKVALDYVREKRLPIVGGDGGGDWYYTTPFHFPQGPMGATIAEAEVRDIGTYARRTGKKKLGTIACTEVDICRDLDRVWNDQATKHGLEPVYRARASLVQPDYTAECLAAQRAGVEVLEIAMDTNSVGRLAQSCTRQGYRPSYGFPASIAKETQEDDPNLEGARATLPTFSWLQNDSPATAEFQAALARYGKGLRPFTGGHTGGWVAGKLFEKGVIAGGTAGKITRETVLAGLYSIRDDTLGGLTGPLAFAAGQNAPRRACSSRITIQDGKWRAVDGGTITC